MFLPPHYADTAFLCKEELCHYEQVTVAPAWYPEVRDVTASGGRGLVAQHRERAASLQWRTSWSAGRPARLHLSVTCSTRWGALVNLSASRVAPRDYVTRFGRAGVILYPSNQQNQLGFAIISCLQPQAC